MAWEYSLTKGILQWVFKNESLAVLFGVLFSAFVLTDSLQYSIKTRTPDVKDLSSQYTGEIQMTNQETDENMDSL